MSDRPLKRINDVEFPDGDDGRLYYDPTDPPPDGPLYPSVTTVLNRHDNPQKERALEGWRNKNDGENGNPYHEHLFWYSGPRGTIAHWYILSHLMGEGNPLAGEEEREALKRIEERNTDWEYVNSVAKNHHGVLSFPDRTKYENEIKSAEHQNRDPEYATLTDILWTDVSWCLTNLCDLFPRMDLAPHTFDESPARTIERYISRDVYTENIINIEQFTYHPEHKYAGQFDLLYERQDGTVVLCDLKTTSGVYWSHKRQLEAYAQTLNREIDELEIVRLQPDRRETQISRLSRWNDTRDELWADFASLHMDVREMVDEIRETVDWEEKIEEPQFAEIK